MSGLSHGLLTTNHGLALLACFVIIQFIGRHTVHTHTAPAILEEAKRSTPFSEAERKHLLWMHNDYKSKNHGSNNRKMKYNMDLEREAFRWAAKCDYRHPTEHERDSVFPVGPYRTLGQNLFIAGNQKREEVHDSNLNITDAVFNWYNEIKDYTYNKILEGDCKPNAQCGHYTQMIWHHNVEMGCGFKYCDQVPQGWYGAYLVDCEYGPGGNYMGLYPYKQGEACSECPKDGKTWYCDNKLCSLEKPDENAEKDDKDDTDGASILSHGHQILAMLLPSLLSALYLTNV